MSQCKRIVLVISASNFEKQKNIIHNLHEKLKQMGGYVLYVVTNYGLADMSNPYDKGAVSIYNILEKMEFDACLLEGNIGNSTLLQGIIEMLKRRSIPFLTLAMGLKGMPYLLVDSYDACRKVMVHLIEEHQCKKINLICSDDGDMFTQHACRAFEDIVKEYGIGEGKDRIVKTPLSLTNAGKALEIFREREIEDTDAILCVHDVYAIGLCLLQKVGINVPEDVLICSLNRSTNSLVFRPDIAGVDRMDVAIAAKACELLQDMLEGRPVPLENFIQGKLCVGQSCGCALHQDRSSYEQNCGMVVSKIEAAKQISGMMEFNASLDQINSLEELGSSLRNMMERIDCKEFICNLNQFAIDYVNLRLDEAYEQTDYFGTTMTAIIGVTERSGELQNVLFSTDKLLPIEEQEGDMLLFYPIHYREKVFGYLTFVNEYLPVDMYNYRICHESIGSSIENLYRQMILRKKIEELDLLHMKDALTGLYNRFGLERFTRDYIKSGEYCIVSMDMDGLKIINDTVGHLAGNHAICIVANAIKETLQEGDLITRCGGDEFQALSHNVEEVYWRDLSGVLNQKIEAQLVQQKLPYQTGVSVGYCISTREKPLEFEDCYAIADQRMYENKKVRKKGK